MDPSTSPKTYQSIRKSFHGNKKIPCIPLIFNEKRLVTDFKEKAELFNSFFAKQCSIVDSGTEIPSLLDPKTGKSLKQHVYSKIYRKIYTAFRFK